MRRLRVPALMLFMMILAACSAPSDSVSPVAPTPTEALVGLQTLPTTTREPTPTRVQAKTPKPWQTMTPMQTATALPSLTPMPTTNATLAPSGMKAEKQKDGTTLITDYDNKYTFSAPSGWAVAPADKQTPSSLLTNLAKDIPNVNRTDGFLYMLAPKVIRAVGINTAAANANPDYPLLLRVALFTDPGKTMMQLDLAMANVRDGLIKEGFTVEKAKTKSYANGLKAGYVDATSTFIYRRASDRERLLVEVHYRVVVFQASGKLYMVSAAAPKAFAEVARTAVDKVVASFTFIK